MVFVGSYQKCLCFYFQFFDTVRFKKGFIFSFRNTNAFVHSILKYLGFYLPIVKSLRLFAFQLLKYLGFYLLFIKILKFLFAINLNTKVLFAIFQILVVFVICYQSNIKVYKTVKFYVLQSNSVDVFKDFKLALK